MDIVHFPYEEARENTACRRRNKKTGVAEHLKAFRHAGLLFNEPTGRSRIALYLVIRKVPCRAANRSANQPT
jgi:hypothetical protein